MYLIPATVTLTPLHVASYSEFGRWQWFQSEWFFLLGAEKNPRPPVKKGFQGSPSDGDSGEGPSADERIRANQRLKRCLNQWLGKHRMGQTGCPQGRVNTESLPTYPGCQACGSGALQDAGEESRLLDTSASVGKWMSAVFFKKK